MNALGDLEDREFDEGAASEEKRYDRYLSAASAREGDDSSEEEDEVSPSARSGGYTESASGAGEEKDAGDDEEEAGGGENLYAALEEDDEFGDFVRPSALDPDDDVLFTKVLASLEMRDGPQHAPMPSSSSEEEGLFDIHGHPELDAVGASTDPPAPPRISVPPLTEEKRAAIKQAMLRFPPPKARPGVDLIVDSILRTLDGKK